MKTQRSKPHSLARHSRDQNPRIAARQTASVRYKTGVVDVDGSFRPLRGWSKNLILDSGLDSVASRVWVDNIAFGVVGTGTDPTQRDSGAITVTVSSGVATASAGFFEAQDVGRLLKLDSGEEGYVTAFNSTTSVDVSMADVGPGEFTIWYVNDTQLASESKRSNTYSLLSAGNGSAWAGSPTFAWTFTRTFIFSAEAGAVTYREVGWSWGANPTALFGRNVLAGGDTLSAGQQYVISVELTLAVSPNSQVAQGDVGTACDTTGTAIWEAATLNTSNETTFAYLDSSGSKKGPSGGGALEPSQVGNVARIAGTLSSITLETNTTNGLVTGGSWTKSTPSAGSFTPGIWSKTFTATFSTAELVGNITAVTFTGTWPEDRLFTVQFTSPIAKSGLQTFTVEFTLSWGRVLSN